MNVHRSVLGTTAIVISLAAAGCPSNEKHEEHESKANTAAAPAPAPTPAPATTAAATTAAVADQAAAVSDTTPLPAPPPDQTETEGTPPSPHHSWVHGYWYWGPSHKYDWHTGYWEDTAAVATMAPPALRVERPGVAPGANYFFAPGYYHWGGKAYDWAPGHWATKRAGYAYVHPVYVEEKGKWARQGFGFEKETDAAYKKRYGTGWEKQGEVLVHKTEVAKFVERGEKEGWMHHK